MTSQRTLVILLYTLLAFRGCMGCSFDGIDEPEYGLCRGPVQRTWERRARAATNAPCSFAEVGYTRDNEYGSSECGKCTPGQVDIWRFTYPPPALQLYKEMCTSESVDGRLLCAQALISVDMHCGDGFSCDDKGRYCLEEVLMLLLLLLLGRETNGVGVYESEVLKGGNERARSRLGEERD